MSSVVKGSITPVFGSELSFSISRNKSRSPKSVLSISMLKSGNICMKAGVSVTMGSSKFINEVAGEVFASEADVEKRLGGDS